MSKKSVRDLNDAKIDQICIQFADLFTDYLNNPPAKLVRFFVEAFDSKAGDEFTYDCKYENETECRAEFKKDGLKITKIVPAKGHHLCKYCNHIADGSMTDLLCDECCRTFGHHRYSKL